MKTSRIKDPKILHIEIFGNIQGWIKAYFPEWEPEHEMVLCPFHDDKKHSLHISPDGRAYCHGCGACAQDITELFAKVEGIALTEAIDKLYRETVQAIPQSKVLAYYSLLRTRRCEQPFKYLTETRGIPLNTLDQFHVGFDPKSHRITIPIYDQFNVCVNIRLMGWTKEQRDTCKVLNVEDHGSARLFPENKIVLERRLLLVEGEFDCLIGRSLGLPTMTWTGGANSWDKRYNSFFAGKAVWLLYDNDKAGRRGAGEAILQLHGVAHEVIVVRPFSEKGKDLSDWIREGGTGDALSLGSTIRAYEFPKKMAVKKMCPACGQEIK